MDLGCFHSRLDDELVWHTVRPRRDEPVNGLIPHLFGCCLLGVQWIAIALALRATRRLHPLAAALLPALAATGAEIVQAVYGLPWIFMALALPAAPTPLAQWAQYITMFGVSFILYFASQFSPGVPDFKYAGCQAMASAARGGDLASRHRLVWASEIIATSTVVQPLSFSALLIQPEDTDDSEATRLARLHRTRTLVLPDERRH